MYPPLFIKWQERNDTGVPIIDEQHRGIVSIINSFYYLTEKGMCDDALCSFISKTIKNYSRIHFLTEERILKTAEYPALEEHIESHKSLAQETERVERDTLNDKDHRLLLEFLKKWWIEHINEQDMLYVPYLREYEKKATDSVYPRGQALRQSVPFR
ncbi:MAG: hemerythrin family protein [Proteobacteria bacterium]|jgi:hemerythrin-like metal-binding protein|nr:hemerythrin family protein [Pseudomonadota bacterium]